MQAEIITIGDEILIGQVIDSNSTWIAEQLNLNGIKVKQISSIADDREHILTALKEAAHRAELIVLTGGLGPTKDDITKSTLCEYFNTKLIFHQDIYDKIKERFRKMKLPELDSNKRQADLPENCIVVPNKNGTASGMWFDKDGVSYISMPGVPFEMKPMLKDGVIPLIKSKFQLPTIIHRTILTHGIGESFLADKIKDWEENLPDNVKLAYLPSPEQLRLRLSISGSEKAKLEKILDIEEEKLNTFIANEIFGHEEESLQEIVGKLLMQKGGTISSAESCTGGNIARQIASIAGCSAYFKGSVIAYSNEVKEKVLNVKVDDLIKHGAVSEPVVKQMALGVKKVLNTDYAIATSGIAGPGGGSEEKPVGTVWIAVAGPDKIIAQKYSFGNKRDINIRRASAKALDNMRRLLLEIL